MAEETPGTVVQLPCGWLHTDGKVYHDAEIVPMTGRTRKALAQSDLRRTPAKVTGMILSQCVRRVGPVTITPQVVEDLLIGDREFLMLQIRRVSMGDQIKVTVNCEGCKKPIEVSFGIDEFKVTPIPKAIELRDGVRFFRIQVKAPPLNVLCRFPNGHDQKILISHIDKNPFEATYKLYASCVAEWNGEKGPFEDSFFEDLPVTILDKFEEGFAGNLPGPDLRQNVPCPECGAGINFTFRGSDFLFRPPKRG